jgi:hypothetical protein
MNLNVSKPFSSNLRCCRLFGRMDAPRVLHRFHSRSYQIASVALAGALMLAGTFAWDQWAGYERAG